MATVFALASSKTHVTKLKLSKKALATVEVIYETNSSSLITSVVNSLSTLYISVSTCAVLSRLVPSGPAYVRRVASMSFRPTEMSDVMLSRLLSYLS